MTRDSGQPVPDPVEVEGESPPAPGTRAGWWAVFALVLVVALIVTVVIAFSQGR